MHNLSRIWILPLIWWLIWIAFHFLMLIQSGWSRSISITDSLISNSMLAAICSGVLYSVQYNRPEPKRLVMLLSGILLVSVFWVWVTGQLLSELFKTETAYIAFLNTTSIIRFFIGVFIITLFAVIGWLIHFIREQVDEKNRLNEASRLARESELMHLRQQLQPHFLFNTLNSISALVTIDQIAAKKMVLQLSDFLRGTIRKDDHKTVTLSDELEYLDLYFDIEKVRFGNRLKSNITLDPDVNLKTIPVFILQPLVENAIKYGLYDTLDDVTIEIHARTESDFLIISISNPFESTITSNTTGTGFGLNAVSRRLFLLFNRSDLMQIEKDAGRFTVTLKIPQ